jgi:hypothetical protein
VVDIVSRYDGSGPSRADGSQIPDQTLARVERFKKCVTFSSSWPCPHFHRSTLDAIRKEWVDHDAKGHVRQLLTSEHIDEEIQDLNRKISNAIEHILVGVLKSMPQEADVIAHVA